MKHEKEINQLLKDLFWDVWMLDWYYENTIDELLNELTITKKQLSDDIETGIENGFSVESQLKLVKLMFENRVWISD